MVMMCFWLTAEAQAIFDLTASQVKIDSLLPVFTWQKQLGPRYMDSVYTVSIAYPEFINMSEADIRRYERISGKPLPAIPDVTQHVSVARKQGLLDVSFVPLVYRNGRYQKLVSFMLKVEATAKTAMSLRAGTRGDDDDEPSRYAEHSVLQAGTWAKIRVPATGFYQLSNDLIKRCGFTDASKVKIYGYGGALQPECLTGDYLMETDDLTEVPTCMIGSQRVFYAVGPVNWETPEATARVRNSYSDYGYYFLTENDEEPLTISEELLKAVCYPTPNDYHSLYETDDYAWYHGGRQLFDKTLFSIGSPQTYQLTANGGAATLTVALTYDASFEATIAVNDSVVGTISKSPNLDYYTVAEESAWVFTLPATQNGENTVTVTQTAGEALRLDYLSFCLADPKPLPDLQSAELPSPEYVYHITNQDHHADEAVDMVIIIPTNQAQLSQAERIKAHHEQKDGLRVRIVPADELFNEFSSGTPDATAYRRYMKMLYDRAETEADMPSYLLLLGDGAWDNRMRCSEWKGYDPDDYLLCFESENSFSHVNCYVSDDFFCLLDDEELIQEERNGHLVYLGKPDVAVGRLPARTEEEARVLTDKLLNYVTNVKAGAWQNTICMMGDDGNDNTHMAAADKVATIIETNHPAYQVKKIYWDAYERQPSSTGYTYPDVTRLIKQQMTAGALMMNYNGHGAPYALSHELVMQLNDFETSTTDHLPLWVTASCDIMPFDGQEENIGETVMLSPKGGGVAFFGTTRTVYASYNEQMNTTFTDYVLKPGYTIGEAIRQAKCDLVEQGRDTSPNKLQYSLLGDPALKLACPQPEIVIDSINGQSVESVVQLSAGSIVKVRGHVVSDDPLDGVVTATVQDVKETIVCRLNDESGAEQPFVYEDRTRTLYQGSNTVSNGSFDFTFAVPKDISYDDGNGLITLFAISKDGQRRYHGLNDSFTLNGSGEAQTDSIGPSIFCYLNSKSFTNGSTVNATPYFCAELYDESGINASGSSVGHDLELVIDGELAKTYCLNDYFSFDFGDYRSGTAGFVIPELSPGRHKLLFRAWDVLNNSSTSELVFNVDKNGGDGDFSVICTKNPATTFTSFIISHDRSNNIVDVTLDVFDMSGRQLWKYMKKGIPSDGTVTIDWDLAIDGGSRLMTGVYIYRIQVEGNGGINATHTNKLVILNNN
jgi:hypothetical protein